MKKNEQLRPPRQPRRRRQFRKKRRFMATGTNLHKESTLFLDQTTLTSSGKGSIDPLGVIDCSPVQNANDSVIVIEENSCDNTDHAQTLSPANLSDSKSSGNSTTIPISTCPPMRSVGNINQSKRKFKKSKKRRKRNFSKIKMIHSTPRQESTSVDNTPHTEEDSEEPTAHQSSASEELWTFKSKDTEEPKVPHISREVAEPTAEPESHSTTPEKSQLILLDQSLDPNALIILDETFCTGGRPSISVISVDSENEDTVTEKKCRPSIISIESDDDSVIAISDDEDAAVSLSKKRKLPDFIPIPEGVSQQFSKKRKKDCTETPKVLGALRPIVIDGSNVAFSHGLRTLFSVKGIRIIVDYFIQRGHRVHVFIPQFRRFHPQTRDGHLLDDMENTGVLHYTPSRRVEGRLICSYDDRFIVEVGAQKKAIIVTRDNFRDLMSECEDKPEWKETISKRLLQYTFVEDMVLFPDDPLGRGGPRLEEFLRFPPEDTPLQEIS